MIRRLSHATIYVLDQDQALDFYAGKLGFEVRADFALEGLRWLTVGPKDQPDLEIILMPLAEGGMFSSEVVGHMRAALAAGAMGTGVFETEDCRAAYEALRGKGVEFISPPQDRPYGVEALFKDDFGNWFSLVERNGG